MHALNIETFSWDNVVAELQPLLHDLPPGVSAKDAAESIANTMKPFLPIDAIKGMQTSTAVKNAVLNDMLNVTLHSDEPLMPELLKYYRRIKINGGTLGATEIKQLETCFAKELVTNATQLNLAAPHKLPHMQKGLDKYRKQLEYIGLESQNIEKLYMNETALQKELEALVPNLDNLAARTPAIAEKIIRQPRFNMDAFDFANREESWKRFVSMRLGKTDVNAVENFTKELPLIKALFPYEELKGLSVTHDTKQIMLKEFGEDLQKIGEHSALLELYGKIHNKGGALTKDRRECFELFMAEHFAEKVEENPTAKDAIIKECMESHKGYFKTFGVDRNRIRTLASHPEALYTELAKAPAFGGVAPVLEQTITSPSASSANIRSTTEEAAKDEKKLFQFLRNAEGELSKPKLLLTAAIVAAVGGLALRSRKHAQEKEQSPDVAMQA